MDPALAGVFSTAVSLFMQAGLIFAMLLAFWLPYMAWSATRNIRQIRQQLERLNDTLESKMTITKSGPLGL
jgi:hypothetical protein